MAWRRARRWRAVREEGSKRSDPNVTVLVKGAKVSNSSVNRDVALISAAIGRLVRLGHLDRNPVRRVRRGKEPQRTRAILSKEECAKLLDACDPHLRIFCLASLLTGARPSELRAVTWGDVSFGNRTITIYRSKVGLGDGIPMHPDLARELKALRKRRAKAGKRVVPDDEHVFLSRPRKDALGPPVGMEEGARMGMARPAEGVDALFTPALVRDALLGARKALGRYTGARTLKSARLGAPASRLACWGRPTFEWRSGGPFLKLADAYCFMVRRTLEKDSAGYLGTPRLPRPEDRNDGTDPRRRRAVHLLAGFQGGLLCSVTRGHGTRQVATT